MTKMISPWLEAVKSLPSLQMKDQGLGVEELMVCGRCFLEVCGWRLEASVGIRRR